MRNLVHSLLMFALCCAWPRLAHAQEPSQPVDRARLTAFVDGAVRQAMHDDHIAGVIVAIVDRQGAIMARGYGRAQLDPDHRVNEDTLFRIASVSKTVTWIGIMQLIEQGKLTLDTPINERLPAELRVPDDGFSEPIRVRHLLAHNAGFEDSNVGHVFFEEARSLTSTKVYLQRYRVLRVRPPGKVGVYSNYGAALAGEIIAHVSGESFVDYAESKILRPLGLRHATFREPYSKEIAQARGLPAPMSADLIERLSEGFFFRAGTFEERKFEYGMHMAAAGSISASAADMAIYLRALLDPARMPAAGVLQAATFRRMQQPLFVNVKGGGPTRYGFLDYTAAHPSIGFGHGGDTLYHHSTLEVFPEQGLGVFISVNTAPGTGFMQPLIERLLVEFYGVAEARPVRAKNARAESERVAGNYLGMRRAYHRTERALHRALVSSYAVASNGDLLSTGGREMRRFVPLGNGVFQQSGSQTRVIFREVGGRMRLHDPYSIAPAERIAYFQTPAFAVTVGFLAVVAALFNIYAAAREALARRTTPAGLALVSIAACWLLALAVAGIAMAPWATPDLGVVAFGYPGTLFPIACWLLLAAAVATPLAVVFIATRRPLHWRWPTWLRAGVTLGVFLALGATLWDWGMLGYSGF